jgi:general secretion pathway protein M
MNRLTGPLLVWWDGRTLRERRMLAVMAVLLAATFVWLAVVRPALAWRAEAGRQRTVAAADLAAVRVAATHLAPKPAAAPATADAGGLEPLVLQTAAAAGLTITTGMDPSGRLGFRIASGSSSAVFGWLAGLQTAHGVEVVSLGVVENTDATLQVEGGLAR